MQLIPLNENIRKNKIISNGVVSVCFTCHLSKPIEEFVKERRRHNGYSTQCKSCERIRSRNRSTGVQ